MFLLFVAAARADCAATSADVLVAIEDAEVAFGGMDLAAFRAATDRATADVACLRDTLPRPVTARLHRVEGLRAFVDNDVVRATAAFASARAIEPNYAFPEALVPAEHPVRERYVQQDPTSGGEVPVARPVDGQIEVDGRPGAARPQSRPVVAQWVRGDGTVPMSAYLWPGQPMFDYGVGSVATVDRTPSRRHTSVPLAIGAGVALAAAGGCYAVSASAHGAYYADDVAPKDLDPLRARANGFFVAGVGTGVAALGLGATAVFVGSW
jgi:hypothetical protein